MKIALLGYGRMGKAIEAIAKQRGHTIVIATSEEGGYDITQADVAIDFSVPNAAFFNIANCLKHGVPVVSGTTGWLHNYDKAVALCKEENGGFIYASNFSLGVNIFFELNRTLARLMGPLDEYKVSMEEIHHTQKLDAPSGTAISLAEGIIKEHQNYSEWVLDQDAPNAVPITAKRIENVPGTHTVTYSSKTDTIEMTHTAHSRDGFALGAVIAAEWLVGKKGVFTMKDVLNIG
ncbi:4-hydroxy-tetrahydrodipicolinate reductase [Mangrovimonas sp. CR14]|uniref:4-hydroxy-tetrahydrodipicolinate reductase n=1 Tax=Mangrovimonas sp. CR14 TaxID=2706120 RepID=UPI00141E3EEF|nr:4-hydroxy-tetrahydrodipicolinate reductase [Mangrovimonas sp. CR14]NIK92730.1 4-hydroxy-tetrahydrodipicolinate reductase [Mangrovimonas sp. CR14]